MNIYRWLILACWLALAAYWAVAAIGVKRNLGGRRERTKAIAARLGIVILILLVLRIPALRQTLIHAQRLVTDSRTMGVLGVALCALGVGIAIWARAHLGRNWGMPMSRKESPKLVMTGPYAWVRHPIYSGILLAMLGSTIGATVFWILPLVLFGTYFVYSARREEQFMMSQFPEQYPAYIKRSHMLLPWPSRTGWPRASG